MKKLSVLFVSIFLMLGGCQSIFENDRENQNEEEPSETAGGEDDRYISVNEYTGEEYRLNGGEANDKLAQEKFDEIEAGVKAFFSDKYKTDVIVHNAVGNIDGATVFVESAGEPSFHTDAVIPFDIEEGNVLSENVWTQDLKVEQSIYGSLLVMTMQEEFKALDTFLKDTAQKHDLTGLRQEAVKNVKASGYATSYYYITASVSSEEIRESTETYLNNKSMDVNEVRQLVNTEAYNPEDLLITINFYMNKEGLEPDDTLLEQILEELKEVEGLPRGSYMVLIHDNLIGKKISYRR